MTDLLLNGIAFFVNKGLLHAILLFIIISSTVKVVNYAGCYKHTVSFVKHNWIFYSIKYTDAWFSTQKIIRLFYHTPGGGGGGILTQF